MFKWIVYGLALYGAYRFVFDGPGSGLANAAVMGRSGNSSRSFPRSFMSRDVHDSSTKRWILRPHALPRTGTPDYRSSGFRAEYNQGRGPRPMAR